jgi:hypothetical protein
MEKIRMVGIKRLYGLSFWVLILLLLIMPLAACGSQPEETPDIQETEETGEEIGEGEELQWDSPPELTLDLEKVYIATLITEKGEVTVELFSQDAPITVNNFVFLAEQGFYDEALAAGDRVINSRMRSSTGLRSTRKDCWRWQMVGRAPTAANFSLPMMQPPTSMGCIRSLGRSSRGWMSSMH